MSFPNASRRQILVLLICICWMAKCSGSNSTCSFNVSIEVTPYIKDDATTSNPVDDDIYTYNDDKYNSDVTSSTDAMLTYSRGTNSTFRNNVSIGVALNTKYDITRNNPVKADIFVNVGDEEHYLNFKSSTENIPAISKGNSSDTWLKPFPHHRRVWYEDEDGYVAYTVFSCDTEREASVELLKDGKVYWFIPSTFKVQVNNSDLCIAMEVQYDGDNAPKEMLQNLTYCKDFLKSSEIRWSNITIGHNAYRLIFPYYDPYISAEISTSNNNLWYKCDVALYRIKRSFVNPRYHLNNIYFHLKYLLMPTIPFTVDTKDNRAEERAKFISTLWIHDPAFLCSCQDLLFAVKNEATDYFQPPPENQSLFTLSYGEVYAIHKLVNDLNKYSLCTEYFATNTTVADLLNIFEIVIKDTKTKLALFLHTSKSFFEFWSDIIFSFLYETDEMLKLCCDKFLGIYNFTESVYFYCYGITDFCNSSDTFWITKIFSEKKTVVVMRSDVTQSEILKSMIMTNIQINTSFARDILALEYSNITDPDKYLIITLLNNQRASLLRALLAAEVYCNKTPYLTVYRKENSFPVYWIIIENCSLTVSETDKILLLLINCIKNNPTVVEHLCKKNIGVLSFQTKRKYTYSNFHASERIFQFNRLFGRSYDSEIFNCLSDLSNLSDNRSYVTSCSEQMSFIVFPLESNNTSHFDKNDIQNTFALNEIFLNAQNEEFTKLNIYYSMRILEMNPVNRIIVKEQRETRNKELQSLFLFMDLLFYLKSCNFTQCIRELISTGFTIHANFSEQIQFVIGPMSEDKIGSFCLERVQHHMYRALVESYDKDMITSNRFWPSCWFDMLISWKGNKTMILDWDYLSTKCKIQEISLITFSFLITAITIIGNAFVLLVLIASGSLNNKPSMIHTSMAVADILLGLMPGSLAVYDQISLINGHLTLRNLTMCIFYSGTAKNSLNQAKGFNQLRYERSGYPMVCSIMMTSSVTVSLFSLVLFSIERLWVIRGKELKVMILRFGICFSWILGIAFSLLSTYRDSGVVFVGYFDPITKITMNIATGSTSLSTIAFYTQLVILATSGLSVIVLIIISIIIHIHQERKIHSELPVHCKNRKRNMNYVTKTFMYMVILFVTSTIPIVVDVLADLGNNYPVWHFLCWWMFMGGMSFNWALYSLRGRRFRQKAKNVFRRFCFFMRSPWPKPQDRLKQHEMIVLKKKRKNGRH